MITQTEDPNQIHSMDLSELIEWRTRCTDALNELEDTKKMIDEVLLENLDKEHLNGITVGLKAITKCSRTTIEVEMEKAKELGATKEVLDQAKLKILYSKGVKFKHVKKTNYIIVKNIDPME